MKNRINHLTAYTALAAITFTITACELLGKKKAAESVTSDPNLFVPTITFSTPTPIPTSTPVASNADYTPVVLFGGINYTRGAGTVQGIIHSGVYNLAQICYVDTSSNLATSLFGTGILATTGNYAYEIGDNGGCAAGTYYCGTITYGCAPTFGIMISNSSGSSLRIKVYGDSATYGDLDVTAVVSP